MGVARPGDMGFDTVHLNLHKTFPRPTEAEGREAVRWAVRLFWENSCRVRKSGKKTAFFTERIMKIHRHGKGVLRQFPRGGEGVVLRATLGAEDQDAAHMAVLNANYLRVRLSEAYHMAYQETCMHEFVMTLQPEKEELQVSAMDIAKALLDYGIHPPTMYFPLIVHEALMVEPTETESPENLES